MKKLVASVVLLTIMLTTFASCDRKVLLKDAQTPAEIREFVQIHFPENSIVQTIKEIDDFEVTFDVTLKGGIFLEFNRAKQIIEIDSKNGTVPSSAISPKITEYVSTNYPDTRILQWEIDDRRQKVKISNAMELEFTKSGEFLMIDD
ncbi:MAG: PepSY-like domain-containing protein [Bacteroidales bacterium]